VHAHDVAVDDATLFRHGLDVWATPRRHAPCSPGSRRRRRTTPAVRATPDRSALRMIVLDAPIVEGAGRIAGTDRTEEG
jgi:hypothetical protein